VTAAALLHRHSGNFEVFKDAGKVFQDDFHNETVKQSNAPPGFRPGKNSACGKAIKTR